jgi:hypothetical protein
MAARGFLVVGIALLVAAGCRTTDTQRQSDTQGVTLRQLRPADTTWLEPPPEPVDESAVLVRVALIEMPLDEDLSAAWALTALGGLDGREVERWRLNGLRVGTMDRFDLPQLDERLPPMASFRRSLRALTDQPRALRFSPRITQPLTTAVQLPGREPQAVTLRAGTLQLNATLQRQADGSVRFVLTPHHHFPRATLEVRTDEQKSLDGQSFFDLTLHANVSADRVLVLGLYRPPPIVIDSPRDKPVTPAMPEENAPPGPEADLPVPENAAAAADAPVENSDNADDDAEDEPRQPRTVPAPLVQRIGTVMMTAQRRQQPMQMLVIISIDDPALTGPTMLEPHRMR